VLNGLAFKLNCICKIICKINTWWHFNSLWLVLCVFVRSKVHFNKNYFNVQRTIKVRQFSKLSIFKLSNWLVKLHFEPIFFNQKITKPKFIREKLKSCAKHFCMKNSRECWWNWHLDYFHFPSCSTTRGRNSTVFLDKGQFQILLFVWWNLADNCSSWWCSRLRLDRDSLCANTCGQFHQHVNVQLLHSQKYSDAQFLFHQQYYAQLYQYAQLEVTLNFYAGLNVICQ